MEIIDLLVTAEHLICRLCLNW